MRSRTPRVAAGARRPAVRIPWLLLAALSTACTPRSALERGTAPVRGPAAAVPTAAAGDRPGAVRPPAPEAEPWAGFARTMLDLVNRDRAAAGLAPVADDPGARAFAAAEARRLVAEGFGHVAADGSKPYGRWSRDGRSGHVRENLFRQGGGRLRSYRLFDPAAAHARLMRSSGHRATILDPAHTGAGVAVIWDRSRDAVYVVQEFVTLRVAADAGPRALRPGEPRVLEGRVLEPAAFRPAAVTLHREPPPGSRAARRAARGGSYSEGGGEPVLARGRDAFTAAPGAGAFRLAWRAPDPLTPGAYTLFLFLEPVGADARTRAAEPFVAAAFTYEAAR